jgi:hypothetical protein
MANREALVIVDRMVRVQFEERSEQLRRDIQLAVNQMTMKGVRGSSLVQRVHDICARDIEIRTLILWQTIRRVLGDVGAQPSVSLADELKDAIRGYVGQITKFPTEQLERVASNAGFQASSLIDARNRAIEKVFAEIDLFTLSLLSRAEAKKESQKGDAFQPRFYISQSTIGSIQTGPSATATVVMNIGSEQREELLRALDLLKQELSTVDDIPGHSKEEVSEIAEELENELQKDKPNRIRISTLFTSVATAIQTLGSLQPAYQAIKSALGAIGISLP